MAEITQVNSLEQALERAASLDLAVTDSLAEIEHEPIAEGATAKFLERAFDEDETVLMVATEGGREVGSSLTGAWTEPLSGERMAGVLALYVHPDVRHQGIARALIAATRDALLERTGARQHLGQAAPAGYVVAPRHPTVAARQLHQHYRPRRRRQ